jgi:hypothetical protein
VRPRFDKERRFVEIFAEGISEKEENVVGYFFISLSRAAFLNRQVGTR